ncbi:MAG: hypothetical protein U0744_12730 [Gemmataceae bacterium]
MRVEAQDLKGDIKIDGSSTVYPTTKAVATNFKKLHPGVKTSRSHPGDGGGFKNAAGETDISDASCKIKDAKRTARKTRLISLSFTLPGMSSAVVAAEAGKTLGR